MSRFEAVAVLGLSILGCYLIAVGWMVFAG